MQEQISELRKTIERSESHLEKLKQHREKYIKLLTEIQETIETLTEQINKSEFKILYYKEEIRKLEKDINKE